MLNSFSSFHYVAFLLLLGSLLLNVQHDHVDNVFGASKQHLLLLTAHPDDECMFFGPTILALTAAEVNHTVHSMCLSSGDADGLGDVRKKELGASLDVLGVDRGRRAVLDEPFKDNITQFWNAELVASHVVSFVEENDIDVILTFDHHGISSHPNHISLYHGTRALLYSLKGSRPQLKAFGLKTVPILPKYTGFLSALHAQIERGICMNAPLSFLAQLKTIPVPGTLNTFLDCTRYDPNIPPVPAQFVATWERYFTTLRAMRQHESQLVWFRYLYVSFSRYMWTNEWEEILVVRRTEGSGREV